VFLAVVIALVLRMPSVTAYAWQNRTDRDIEREMRYQQYKELNKERQKKIRDDTEKLFQLATELKAAVEKSNENVLSVDVVRKAGEVEKLAKRVKENMKESMGPPPHEPRSPPIFPRPPR
jgi:isoleucyl-tRNA synthetase